MAFPIFIAIYGEYNAVFSIDSISMLEGDFPPRAHRLVEEWGKQYKQDLQQMWENQEFKQLPGLE